MCIIPSISMLKLCSYITAYPEGFYCKYQCYCPWCYNPQTDIISNYIVSSGYNLHITHYSEFNHKHNIYPIKRHIIEKAKRIYTLDMFGSFLRLSSCIKLSMFINDQYFYSIVIVIIIMINWKITWTKCNWVCMLWKVLP